MDHAALRYVMVRHLTRGLRLQSFDLALTAQPDGTILAVVSNAVRKQTHGGQRRSERHAWFSRQQAALAA